MSMILSTGWYKWKQSPCLRPGPACLHEANLLLLLLWSSPLATTSLALTFPLHHFWNFPSPQLQSLVSSPGLIPGPRKFLLVPAFPGSHHHHMEDNFQDPDLNSNKEIKYWFLLSSNNPIWRCYLLTSEDSGSQRG